MTQVPKDGPAPTDAPELRGLLSVGHSNHPFPHFAELLRMHRIEVVVDVRSVPFSRRHPQFNAQHLDSALSESGIGYMALGERLGGRPKGPEFYDAKGRALYDSLAKTPFFRSGLRQLREVGERARTAMLCSEEDPGRCHRFHLITRALHRDAVMVGHIRGDGARQDTESVPSFRQWPDRSARLPGIFSDRQASQL